ncbi:MAG: hypothetical protein AAF684_01810 [Pseudomonadota bacterium]
MAIVSLVSQPPSPAENPARFIKAAQDRSVAIGRWAAELIGGAPPERMDASALAALYSVALETDEDALADRIADGLRVVCY